jgi:hypothetical protein
MVARSAQWMSSITTSTGPARVVIRSVDTMASRRNRRAVAGSPARGGSGRTLESSGRSQANAPAYGPIASTALSQSPRHSRSTGMKGRNGAAKSGVHPPAKTRNPTASDSAAAPATSADFPMPGSPPTTTVARLPEAAVVSVLASLPLSMPLPTNPDACMRQAGKARFGWFIVVIGERRESVSAPCVLRSTSSLACR